LTYASQGVTFGIEGNGCGAAVYANSDRPAGFGSAPNVVSACGGSGSSDINGIAHGRIRADFSQPATRVCIDVLPDGQQYNAVLSVHDADDKLIAQTASQPGVTGTICATGTGIRHARFPGTGDTNTEYARFDNLDVTFAAATANYQGLWWRTPAGSEAGWGVNVAHQGDTLFATWFTYDLDGKPWWLAVVANLVSPGVYSGDLFTTTGPPFNAVPFDPAGVVETTVGTATFTFADNNHGTFAYAVNTGAPARSVVTQTKNITRQVYATPVPHCVWGGPKSLAAASNYQDLWWKSPASSESGWGINFTHQGNTVFATWFTYDASGKPWWLAFVADRTGPGVYAGNIFTTTGPPFNAVPFDPAKVVETTVGTATLTYTDGNNASFDYTVNAVSQTKPVTRQVFAAPGTFCQ
jgi:hypothetical protein